MAFFPPCPSMMMHCHLTASRQFMAPVFVTSRRMFRAFRPSMQSNSGRQVRSVGQQQLSPSPNKRIVDSSLRQCRLYDIRDACVPYQYAWDWQHELVNELKANPSASDALLLLEHEPVYTLGTASKLKNVLFEGEEVGRGDSSLGPKQIHGGDKPAALIRTERGGEVTYHGPGQLVAYPILNLHRHKLDLHWYLRSLEDVVLDMLRSHYGIQATRKQGLTGVFVGEDKICALGLKVSKWITMHGLALNVNTDLSPFRRIIPCGIGDCGVTSLAALLGPENVCMDSARDNFVDSFAKVFGPVCVQWESENLGTAENADALRSGR